MIFSITFFYGYSFLTIFIWHFLLVINDLMELNNLSFFIFYRFNLLLWYFIYDFIKCYLLTRLSLISALWFHVKYSHELLFLLIQFSFIFQITIFLLIISKFILKNFCLDLIWHHWYCRLCQILRTRCYHLFFSNLYNILRNNSLNLTYNSTILSSNIFFISTQIPYLLNNSFIRGILKRVWKN